MPKPKNPHYKTDTLNKEEPKQEEVNPAVKYVVDCWESWDTYWGSRYQKFEGYYDRWIGTKPKRDEDWQSDFHKRLTWQAEKTLVARYHAALFPTSAPIDTEAVDITDEMPRILAKSIVAHWFKVGLIPKEFLSGMRSSAVYGSGLFEDDWYVRKEPITEKVEEVIADYRAMVDPEGNKIFDDEGNIRSEQVGYKKVLRERSKLKVVEDRYRLKKANIFSWRIHPSKLDDDDDFPVIKQEFVTYDALLEKQIESEKYGFKKFDGVETLKENTFKLNENDIRRHQKEGYYYDEKSPLIELLHFWGLYADGEKGEKKPMWIIVANRKHLLRKKENPFWHKKPPLFHINWTEDVKDSYWGIGVAQVGADAEDRANVTVNIRTDIKRKNVRGSGWYNANDKKINKQQLKKNVPGLMRPCSDVNNAVKYDVPPPVDPTDYTEETTAVNDHREITGATSSLLPTENKSAQPDTLGGMQQNLSQAISRLKPDLSMMELMGIRKIANRALLLSRQFMSKEETIELVAPEDKLKQLNVGKIYTMSPKELIGQVHFFCTGLSETVDKLQNIDKLLKYAEVTSKIPAMQQVTNYQAIAKRIALWLGFEDVNEFVIMNQMPQIPAPVQSQPQPGIPQPIPGPQTGIPVNRPPMIPGAGGMPGRGLPPQLIQMIVQGMMNRQPPQIANQAGMVR